MVENAGFTIFSGAGVEEIEELLVFDRWGELVFVNRNFQPNDPSIGWRGTGRNGQKVVPGVFVFSAKMRLTDGRLEVLKGDLTVLR